MTQDISATIKRLGVFPLVKHYITTLNLYNIFDKYIPKYHNATIAPAEILCMMVTNIICSSSPLYKVDEWVTSHSDGLTEEGINAAQYNDDQLGRCLDKLFIADRGTMLAELSANAIMEHHLEINTLQNDSTSITLSGQYEGHEAASVALARGYNKDGHPECKQIVFGLNITADGNIPISFQLFDGNQPDDTTHIPNWEALRQLIGKEDFVYIADSKLCSLTNLGHIDKHGGIFITLMPKNWLPVKHFNEYIQENDVMWQDAITKESTRKKGSFVTYTTHEQEKTKQGYRLIWVNSSAKKLQDHSRRKKAIDSTLTELESISKRLNKYKLKTEEQIQAAIKKACKGKKHLFNINLSSETIVKKVQTSKGRPSSNTTYRDNKEIQYKLEFELNEEAVIRERRTDGIFPLVTNSSLPAADVLKKYKNQSYLEKRMYTAKSILKVAPVFLEKPTRIEAMLFLYFIALMIVGLIERSIRKNMAEEKIEAVPIRPGGNKCQVPTWNNIDYFFREVHQVVISKNDNVISTQTKGITKVHILVLKLLGVPSSNYRNTKDQWWLFETT